MSLYIDQPPAVSGVQAKQGNERLFRCHSQATNKRRPLRLPTADFAAFQRKLTAEFGTSEVQFVLGGMPVDITNADDLQLALAECPQGDLIELSILDGPPAPAALTPSPGLTSGRVHPHFRTCVLQLAHQIAHLAWAGPPQGGGGQPQQRGRGSGRGQHRHQERFFLQPAAIALKWCAKL